MSEAPERIWMDPDIKFPECEKKYACDVEYIRADLVEAAVKRALEGAASIAKNACRMFPYKGYPTLEEEEVCRVAADYIMALNPAQFIDGEK